MQQPLHIDIETLLEGQFERKLKFVGLGRITEKPPSGGSARRVYLDDAEWWSDFVLLAEGATLIVVMPDPSDHCVREASWLRTEKLLSKCIFYMRGSVRRGEGWYEPEWNKSVERFREVGIMLPAYNAAGAIFTLYLSGTTKKIVTLDFTKTFFRIWRLRDRLRQLGEPVRQALAHNLVSATPAEYSMAMPPPTELRLKFSEGIEIKSTKVKVTVFPTPASRAAWGLKKAIQTGPPKLDPNDNTVLIVPLRAPLPDGEYRVSGRPQD